MNKGIIELERHDALIHVGHLVIYQEGPRGQWSCSTVSPSGNELRGLLATDLPNERAAKEFAIGILEDEMRERFGSCAHQSITTPDGNGAYCRFCGETVA